LLLLCLWWLLLTLLLLLLYRLKVIIVAAVRLREPNERLHYLYQLLVPVCILLSSLARSARNLNI
jgi:hypothetical protein